MWPSLFTPLTSPSTSFPNLFSFLFLEPVPLCLLTTAMLKESFFQTQQFQWTGDLAGCESVTFPFCYSLVGCYWIFPYYVMYYPLLCWQFLSSLFWPLIPIAVSYCKWNQLTNDMALGMHIPCQGILKPPFCTRQALLTLAAKLLENILTLSKRVRSLWITGNCSVQEIVVSGQKAAASGSQWNNLKKGFLIPRRCRLGI